MTADPTPIPVDLAREPDFSLGSVRVRPSLRQVESAGESETLEPRVMQVLVVLARRPAEVVSRDDLIETCWSGRIVGEDAISRVIARVRRLGEASGAFAIETIPRVGYRLMLPHASGKGDAVEPPKAERPVPAVQTRTQKLLPWLLAGGAALAVLGASLFVLRPATPDVDTVVARLSDRLRADQRATPAAGDAVRQLGASARAEERSAFAALASDDGEHALEILEDLARVLESSGDTKAAAQAWRRVGAIAPLFDDARAVAAQRKAFALDPESLGAFQNLFFVTFLQSSDSTDAFLREVLDDARLSDRMRGWALSHQVFFESDVLGERDKARATLAELQALRAYATDPVLQAAGAWSEALIAFNDGDLASAHSLAEAAMSGWSAIPEKTSNSPEGLLFRVNMERGDWNGTFRLGVDMFERRSREGDLLPALVGWGVCETGIFIGQEMVALPYCESSVRRGEGAVAMVKAFAGVVATLEGDHARAAREFETAHGNMPPGGSTPARVVIFEAWAAQKAGDVARAERILASRPGGRSWEEATRARPSVHAAAKRLLGEWLVAAGQPKRACEPLAEAARIYDSFGGDAGRDAVNAVRAAAGCRQD